MAADLHLFCRCLVAELKSGRQNRQHAQMRLRCAHSLAPGLSTFSLFSLWRRGDRLNGQRSLLHARMGGGVNLSCSRIRQRRMPSRSYRRVFVLGRQVVNRLLVLLWGSESSRARRGVEGRDTLSGLGCGRACYGCRNELSL